MILVPPTWSVAIQAPDYLINRAGATQSIIRLNKAIAKRTLKATLLNHYSKFFKLHFQRGNRSRYAHKMRTSKYRHRKKKEFGSTTDLVKTGRSRRYMTSQVPIIRMGYTGGGLRGRMFIKWPTEMTTKGTLLSSTGVTWEQMNRELSNWHESELKHAAHLFEKLYIDDLRIELGRRPRLQKFYKKF